jgi:hypothetical protein
LLLRVGAGGSAAVGLTDGAGAKLLLRVVRGITGASSSEDEFSACSTRFRLLPPAAEWEDAVVVVVAAVFERFGAASSESIN